MARRDVLTLGVALTLGGVAYAGNPWADAMVPPVTTKPILPAPSEPDAKSAAAALPPDPFPELQKLAYPEPVRAEAPKPSPPASPVSVTTPAPAPMSAPVPTPAPQPVFYTAPQPAYTPAPQPVYSYPQTYYPQTYYPQTYSSCPGGQCGRSTWRLFR